MSCLQANEQMNMVFNTPDALRNCIQPLNDTAEVFVQLFAPRKVNLPEAEFCGKYDMKEKGVKYRFEGIGKQKVGAMEMQKRYLVSYI